MLFCKPLKWNLQVLVTTCLISLKCCTLHAYSNIIMLWPYSCWQLKIRVSSLPHFGLALFFLFYFLLLGCSLDSSSWLLLCAAAISWKQKGVPCIKKTAIQLNARCMKILDLILSTKHLNWRRMLPMGTLRNFPAYHHHRYSVKY